MKFIVKFSSLFSSLIAVCIVADIEISCENDKNFQLCQAPYFTWEQRALDRSFEKLQKQELQYDKNIKEQVMRLILKYKTGLKKSNIENLSIRIAHEGKKYGYDPLLLAAVIITESSFYNWAKSKKGALGLMQIQPATGKELASEVHLQWKGKPTLFDPETNIALGAYYLNKLDRRFGDFNLALEAYNHGPTKLKRYLKKGYRPKLYSQTVFRRYRSLKSSAT